MKTMRKRNTSAAVSKAAASGALHASPSPLANLFQPFLDFDLKTFNNNTPLSSSKKNKTLISAKSSVFITTTTTAVNSPSQKTLTTISDLKRILSSRYDSLKRHLDLSHSEITKDLEASHSRLSKRFKIHAQTCQQVMDEADQECNKLSDLVTHNLEAFQTSYAEIITRVETSATHVCQTSIPELVLSVEKSVEGMRRRYGIPVNPS